MRLLINIILALALAQTLCWANETMPRLPPRWRVSERSEKGWRLEGRCSGGLPLLQNEVGRHLLVQGWRWDDAVRICDKPPRIWLGIWRRQPHERMAILLCEQAAAKWTFRLGKLDANKVTGTPLDTGERMP